MTETRYVIVDRKRRQALGPSSPPTPGSSKNDAMTVSEVAEVDMDDSDLTGSVSDQGLEDLQDMDLSFGFDSQSPSTNTTASYYTPPGKDLSVSFPILPEEIQGFSGTPNTWLHQTEPSIPWDNSMPNLGNPWNVEHLFPTDRNAVDNTIPLEPNKSASSHRSTLILEDVQPDTVNCIMNTLFKSNTKVKMRLFSQE